MSREWIVRRNGLGRVAIAVMLGLSVTACSKFGSLKAMKHFKDANGLYQQQDYRNAAKEYEEVVKADPEMKQAYFYLANSYDNLYKPARKGEAVNDGYLQDALKYYQRSVEKLQGSTDARDIQLRKRSLQYLAAVYATDKLNDPDKAEPVVKQLIDMDPKDTSNYSGLAKIYEDAGKFEQAEAALKQAEQVGQNSTDVLATVADYYNRRGEFDKAMERYEQISKLEPTNPQAFYNLALRYEEKVRKDYRLKPAEKQAYIDKGMTAIDKAIELRPDYFEALTYKGLLLRQQALLEKNAKKQKELLDEAEKYQKKAIEVQTLKAKGVGAT